MSYHSTDQQLNKDLQARLKQFCKGVRCIDCEKINNYTTIDLADSPVAQDQRKIIRTLLRKGYSDEQIRQEVKMTFGRHSVLSRLQNDGSQSYSKQTLINIKLATFTALAILAKKGYNRLMRPPKNNL